MFQDFEDRADPARVRPRLEALRAGLGDRGLDGFIVPRADEFQGEYVPACAERLSWLTGFTGSAGQAVVLEARAALFVDGRYTLQARDQTDTGLVEIVHIADTTTAEWIGENVPRGARLGFDPWLHTVSAVKTLREACERAGVDLVPVPQNPVDAVWADRPAPPMAPAVVQPLALTGRESAEKRKETAEALASKNCDAAVLNAPDSIAWLLNVRGADVPHTPFVLSFAVVHADGRVDWFVAPEKVGPEVRDHLGGEVTILSPEGFTEALGRLGARGATVWIDPDRTSEAVRRALTGSGARMVEARDPCQLPKARKTPVEVAGARAAHERDGVALVRFLHWLAATAGDGTVTEIEATQRLEAFRRDTGCLKDISFDTISGAGPNGAIVHYRVTKRTNRVLEPGSLFLVDSGGQYVDGTTDVTRTVAIGMPTEEMRDRFTRVLKGHIGIAGARFPKGTTGAVLDGLARYWLWQAGLDFDHGTGHGVGSYLSVHEGPQGIHKRAVEVALEPGMIVSNEPGYYREGAYGIRIENLVVVTPPSAVAGGEREMMGFETLTLAPIDRACIAPGLLLGHERDWLNAYHARVRDTLTPHLDADAAAWLARATEPV